MIFAFYAQSRIDEIINNFSAKHLPELELLLADKIRLSIPLSSKELQYFEIEELVLEEAA